MPNKSRNFTEPTVLIILESLEKTISQHNKQHAEILAAINENFEAQAKIMSTLLDMHHRNVISMTPKIDFNDFVNFWPKKITNLQRSSERPE